MKLSGGEIGKTYEVEKIDNTEQVTRRLEALGMTGHAGIKVLNKKEKGSMIIKVRGTRWAIGRRIADGITVREAQG